MTRPAHYPSEPAALWQRFFEITRIPRPSAAEEAVTRHVIALADARDCPWQTDARGNLVVRVPASAGRESESAVIIQNHLDMVTVKTDDKQHDFDRDPLELKVEEDWLLADRTTLGADNGIGCAAALALMDVDVSHPPLELLFTVEEESGLWGATDLDAGLLTGTRMLNLDGEGWGDFFVGCAGGRGWELRRSIPPGDVAEARECWRLQLHGLSGGHSGIEIHLGLASAIKLMGQWLVEARELDVQLVGFEGGTAHNVIPREASLCFLAPDGARDALEALNQRLLARWQTYLREPDSAVSLELAPEEVAAPVDAGFQRQFEQMLMVFPHGPMAFNAEHPAELVDLSINLAVVRIDAEGLFLETTVRYFNRDESEALSRQVAEIAGWMGCEVAATIDYPGWEPNFDSPLLDLGKSIYQLQQGEPPAVKAIHAGLECGILKGKLPDCDILSFGPTILGAHSPRERLEISTVPPFWQLLTGILERI